MHPERTPENSRPTPAAAVKVAESGPNALDRGSALRVRLFLTESEAEKIGFGDRWRHLLAQKGRRLARRANAESQLAALVASIQERGTAEEWSLRKLTQK